MQPEINANHILTGRNNPTFIDGIKLFAGKQCSPPVFSIDVRAGGAISSQAPAASAIAKASAYRPSSAVVPGSNSSRFGMFLRSRTQTVRSLAFRGGSANVQVATSASGGSDQQGARSGAPPTRASAPIPIEGVPRQLHFMPPTPPGSALLKARSGLADGLGPRGKSKPGGVARILAPNGQPRKYPAALLDDVNARKLACYEMNEQGQA